MQGVPPRATRSALLANLHQARRFVGMENVLAAIGGIMAGLLVFSGMLLGGLQLVRWLGLTQEAPLSAQLVPPAPPMRSLVERAGAPAVAALQARRAALFSRAMPLRVGADPLKPASVVTAEAATAAVADLSLDPVALDRADQALTALGV